MRHLLFQALQNLVVILMTSNPKRRQAVFSLEGGRPVGSSDINRPNPSFRLESERGMMGILLEELVFLDCQVLHFGGEFCK